MKLLLVKTLSLGLLLFSGSQLQGYAIVHGSESILPAVDIYTYQAKNAQDAMRQHKSFALLLSVPDTVVNVLDKIKGVSAPVGLALAVPTEGISVALAEGFGVAVDALKFANSLLGNQIKDGLGRLHRGDSNGYHSNVPRGNRGRFAEWRLDNDVYVVVTLPGSLLPLHEGAVVSNMPTRKGSRVKNPDHVVGFRVEQSEERDENGNPKRDSKGQPLYLYHAIFDQRSTSEYMQAADDKRSYKDNKNEMLKVAKEKDGGRKVLEGKK